MPANIVITGDRERSENWNAIYDSAHELGLQISQNAEESFDTLAFVPPGGLAPALMIGSDLGFTAADYLSVPITHNTDPKTPHIKYSQGELSPKVLGKVLLLSDVWRTGGLLTYAADTLRWYGASVVRIGVLKWRTDVDPNGDCPDFWGYKEAEQITFPWNRPPAGRGAISPVRRATSVEIRDVNMTAEAYRQSQSRGAYSES